MTIYSFTFYFWQKIYRHRHSGAGRNPVFTRAVDSSGCRIKPGMTTWRWIFYVALETIYSSGLARLG